MAGNVHQLREKARVRRRSPSIRLRRRRIDLLRSGGVLPNRTDLSDGDPQPAPPKLTPSLVDRPPYSSWLRDYSRADPEAVRAAKEKLHIRVVGLARIAPDVTLNRLATIDR
jgi:hypothetical protein